MCKSVLYSYMNERAERDVQLNTVCTSFNGAQCAYDTAYRKRYAILRVVLFVLTYAKEIMSVICLCPDFLTRCLHKLKWTNMLHTLATTMILLRFCSYSLSQKRDLSSWCPIWTRLWRLGPYWNKRWPPGRRQRCQWRYTSVKQSPFLYNMLHMWPWTTEYRCKNGQSKSSGLIKRRKTSEKALLAAMLATQAQVSTCLVCDGVVHPHDSKICVNSSGPLEVINISDGVIQKLLSEMFHANICNWSNTYFWLVNTQDVEYKSPCD